MEHLLYYRCKICFCLRICNLVQVHKYCDKRSLSICGHKCDHLILDHLDTTVYLFFDSELCDFIYLFFVKLKTNAFKFIFYLLAEFKTAYLYKWCKVCKRYTLSAILRACYLCDCLCCYVTCSRKALWCVYHRLAYYCSVLQHIL